MHEISTYIVIKLSIKTILVTLLLILRICLSVAEFCFSKPLFLRFTVNLLMILKLKILQNFIMNFNRKIFFSCDYIQFKLYRIISDFSDSNRLFVFPGSWPFACRWPWLWPPVRLPALAPNLCLPAVAPNLYLPVLANSFFTNLGPEIAYTNLYSARLTGSRPLNGGFPEG